MTDPEPEWKPSPEVWEKGKRAYRTAHNRDDGLSFDELLCAERYLGALHREGLL